MGRRQFHSLRWKVENGMGCERPALAGFQGFEAARALSIVYQDNRDLIEYAEEARPRWRSEKASRRSRRWWWRGRRSVAWRTAPGRRSWPACSRRKARRSGRTARRGWTPAEV